MSGTRRLYHEDSLLLGFDARVVAHAVWEGRPSVILDQTAFYPESGGQMADRGVLAGQPVMDVQVDDAGTVHHVLQGELPAVGTGVHGDVDRARRRTHMALHTGQHMLSAALLDVCGAETVSSRLGDSACTIDLDKEKLEDADLARAEDLVNSIIDDDVPVRAYFPAPGELAALTLRRKPKVTENVRVVQVGDFDLSPCGGTHCTHTSQVELCWISGVERYKGKVRVTFATGPRARGALMAESRVLHGMARGMTCGPLEVEAGLQKVRDELREAQQKLGAARARVAHAQAETLLAGGPRVVAVFDDEDVEFLRVVARRVTALPEGLALLGARTPEGIHVMASRGVASTFDCGALVKKLAEVTGGRGGGKPGHAEGRIPAGADFISLVGQHA